MYVKKLRVERTFNEIWEFVGGVFFCSLLFIPSIICYFNYPIFGLILIFLVIRVYIYAVVDFLFSKSFKIEQEEVSLKVAGIEFKIDKEVAFFVIENVDVPTTGFSRTKGLVLVRNSKFFINRIFKNKIKLVVGKGDKDPEYLYEFGANLSQQTGIRFIGVVRI